MNLENIMKQITSGLTGDAQRDARYLYDQVEQYKNTEYADDVARGCAEILREMIPDDQRKVLDQLMRQDTEINEAMNKAQEQMNKGFMTKAREILSNEIRQVERDNLYEDNTEEEFRAFDEPFEQVMYRYRSKTKRHIVNADDSVEKLYFLYGLLLSQNAEMGAARKAFQKALHYNPVSSTVGLQIAETYKQEGKLNKFINSTLNVLQNAFQTKVIGQCMQNFSYYFAENEKWQEAFAYLLLSLTFEEESQSAKDELNYIQEQAQSAGIELHEPTPEDFQHYEQRYGFLTHADPDVVGIAWATGKHNFDEGSKPTAKYFLQIVYDLTKDEETKELLAQI